MFLTGGAGAAGGALMYVEKRKIIELFPESVRKVWNDWELRALILLSLTSQIVLVLFGNRRKYNPKTRIRVALWCAYLMADWLATVALGVISKNVQIGCNKIEKSISELSCFWSPFLLLHLGGPDTITAYALEDNELWLRHFVALLIQTGVALYIFLLAWDGSSWFPVISLLILVAGLIKYGERTWALWSANTKHFRNSMLTRPEPGPNYAKFMEEFTLKRAEGFYVEADEVIELPVPTNHAYPDGEGNLICEAYVLFQTFKRLFVDLILSFQDRERSQSYFLNLSTADDAFHVIEVELGFAFDVLFTKAPVTYTPLGCILRLVSFTCTFSGLVAFQLLLLCEKNKYHKVDLTITYLLLVVALLLDMYGAWVMLLSDWTDHWLSKHNRTRDFLITPCLRQQKKQWWSNKMAQYNALSVCLRDKPAVCHGLQRLLQVDELRENHRYKTYSGVSTELKALIFDQFKKFTKGGESEVLLAREAQAFSLRVELPLPVKKALGEKLEFDQSILIWHIATDLCYYSDGGESPMNRSSNCRESKHLSDYMLYLLVMCPFMLPIGIGMIRFRDTCAEAREFFLETSPRNTGKACAKARECFLETSPINIGKAKACEKLLHVNTAVPPAKVKGDRSKSVLFDACRLAKSLRSVEGEGKWEIMSQAWVEMLAYAATRCGGNHHAQQLRKGGELLTHVWLLMAHLGITEQFQIDQGHARAKLIVK